MELDTVHYERLDGKVGLVTLSRPEKLNALNQDLWRDLMLILEEADYDGSINAIVLTGAGEAFSAGADITPGGGQPPDILSWYEAELVSHQYQRRIREVSKPIVAGVKGWCIGWGFELAISCDMLIASQDAKFGAPEIRHGTMVASILPWLIGPMWARRLIYTGDIIDAHKALEIGLVIEVVPNHQLMENAITLARRIAQVPHLGVRLNKRALDGTLEMAGIDNGLAYSHLASAICHSLADRAETPDGRNLEDIRRSQGLKAFLETRDSPFRVDKAKGVVQ